MYSFDNSPAVYLDEESFEMFKNSGYKSKFIKGVECIEDEFKVHIHGIDLIKKLLIVKQPKFKQEVIISGGRFDYTQFRLSEPVEIIKDYIDKNGKELTKEEIKNHWQGEEWFEKYPEDRFHHKYSDETIEEFKKGIEAIKLAQVYMQRIDWLLSDDDGEESFHKRLKEDLDEIRS